MSEKQANNSLKVACCSCMALTIFSMWSSSFLNLFSWLLGCTFTGVGICFCTIVFGFTVFAKVCLLPAEGTLFIIFFVLLSSASIFFSRSFFLISMAFGHPWNDAGCPFWPQEMQLRSSFAVSLSSGHSPCCSSLSGERIVCTGPYISSKTITLTWLTSEIMWAPSRGAATSPLKTWNKIHLLSFFYVFYIDV